MQKVLKFIVLISITICLFGCEKERQRDEIVSYVPSSSGPFVDKASGDWAGDGNNYLMQIKVETNKTSGKQYYVINIMGEDEGYPFYYMVGENSDDGIVYKYGHKIVKDEDGIEVPEYGDDRGQLIIEGNQIIWKSSVKDIEVRFTK